MEDLHIVVDEKFVICKECGKKLEKIDGRHTKKSHGITFQEYKTKYPNTPTITRKRLELEIINNEKRKKSKEEKNNQVKDVICCNPDCPRQGKPFKANINVSNKYSSCIECKKNGYKHPKRIEIHKKQIEGMKRVFGVSNPSYCKKIVETRQKTVNKNKDENPNYYEEIVEKRVETFENDYGENWKNIFHKKSEDGMKRIYGNKYALQITKFQNKFFDTMIERTGFKTKFHDPNFQKQFVIDVNPMDRPGVKEKISESLTESWKDPEVRKKRKAKLLKEFLKKLEKYLELYEIELLEEYQHSHYKHKWKCKKCGLEYIQMWNSIHSGYKCPKCYSRNTNSKSKAQIEIEDFIELLGFKIFPNDRHVIKPYELDIVIHSEKIAIEYNGLYFHQESVIEETRKNLKVDSKYYHRMKLEMCIEKGYKLITIFEDEWVLNKELVKERLKNILGKNTSERIHGRKCIIQEISPPIKNEFLDKYHLQGKDNSVIKLGAFYNNELISVMTFSHGSLSKGIKKSNKDIWELNRFCSNYNYRIPGIASKLLEHFKRNYEWKEIFSFADRRWSDGNLYKILKFKLNKITDINYWYIDLNKCHRIHRFSLRKRPDEPKDISERILRTSEGYRIIWDCGNLKFSIKNN